MDMLFDDEMLVASEKIPEIKIPSFEKWVEKEFKQVDYRIVIPTYKRPETLKKKTLALLKGKIDPEIIDVFVASEDEKKIYEKTLEPGTYGKIIVGVVGMRAIRNFIQDYYPEGTLTVNLDDDVEVIQKYVDEKTLVDLENLNEFFCYAFTFSEVLGSTYWGVYGVNNPYFMDNSVAVGLRYLEGSFWGCKVNHDKLTYVTLDDKEDFERSLRAYSYNNTVTRYDFVTFESKFWTEPGGMQYDGKRTPERVESSGRKLLEIFPELCKENTARKKHFEVKLVEQRPEYKKYNKRIHFEEE